MTKKMSSKILLTTVTGLFVAPAIINTIILKLAKNNKKKIENVYHWTFGDINFIKKGVKGAPPVLLIHGIGAGESNEEWHKNISTLCKNHEVYALDLLGFGLSDRPPLTYTAYLYTILINDFINDVIQKPASVVASNSSAAFALMSSVFNENNFKKLVLICPTGINAALPSNKNVIVRKIVELPVIGTAIYNFICSHYSIIKFLKKYVYFREIPFETINGYYISAHIGGPNSRFPIAALLSNHLNVNIEKALTQLKIPTLVVWGENEQKINNAAKLKNLNSQIKLKTIENTKMLPHVESAREFNTICKDFLEDRNL